MKARAGLTLSSALLLIILLAAGSATWAGTLEASATPGSATANSVFNFTVVATPGTDETLTNLTLYVGGEEFVAVQGGALKYAETPALYTYRFRLSAGLDMLNVTVPGVDADAPRCWPWYPDLRYCPSLLAEGDGDPQAIHWIWQAQFGEGEPIKVEGDVTVHDSFVYNGGMLTVDRYAGQVDNKDYMTLYPYGWPLMDYYKDPLVVVDRSDENPAYGADEGTSTSTYVFRVNYRNEDGLPPLPWVHWWYDDWNPYGYRSGVMVYLRNMDEPGSQWEGHFMFPDLDPVTGQTPFGTVYTLRIEPNAHIYERLGDGHWNTGKAFSYSTNHYYEALRPGRYQYFISVSDNDYSQIPVSEGLSRDEPDAPGGIWPVLEDYPPLPVDPTYEMLFGRYGLNFSSGYVDKFTYMPGYWGFWSSTDPSAPYPFDSWEGPTWDATGNYPMLTFPDVNPGLYGVGDNHTWGSLGEPEGGARFMGTLSPYRRSVNPKVPYQDSDGHWRLWAETAGGTTADVFTFQVTYQHTKGIAPSYVGVYINDGWNADASATGGDSTFTFHEMEPVISTPTADDYKSGVIYKYQTTLPAGSHCYYFEAHDPVHNEVINGRTVQVGSRVCRYPRRPQTWSYDGAMFWDHYLPSGPDYQLPVENDFINGPYINTKSVLSNWSVTPAAGATGTDFVFRVKYTDADGQRPYTPYIIIQLEDGGTLENGGAVRCNMVKEDSADNDYTDGVMYVVHTSSIPGLILPVGLRRYRFEFTDDWGRQTDANDRVQGQLARAPESGWIDGPQVRENSAPRLTQGSVTSPDGSSNEATLWTYKVTYTDADDHPPAYMLVYIGRMDTGSGEIVWDGGHAMSALDSTDSIYSDGKGYVYQTRLEGDSTPINYYYAFVASDGVDRAQYGATTSPSSGIIWKPAETLTSISGSTTRFGFAHSPVVDGVPASPVNPSYYSGPSIYDDGTLLTSSQYTLDVVNGVVTLSNPASGAVTAQYWFATAGPSSVGSNNPPTLSSGKVSPSYGRKGAQYTFSVIYKDGDGTFGQAPAYMNLVLDGNRYAMTVPAGNYKTGVTCTFRFPYDPDPSDPNNAMVDLSNGQHSFYFEASDGGGFAVFDQSGNRSSDAPISTITPITGPYVTEKPTLTDGAISPNPPEGISTAQPVIYSVTYTDTDNEAPNSGYPVVYVDNPTEAAYTGTATAVSASTIRDGSQSWTVDEFKGMPVQITSGASNGIVFNILSNTSTTLTLLATDVLQYVSVGDTFSIGKIIMSKQDNSDSTYSDGVVYEARVPSLGMGSHEAHLKVVVTETIAPGKSVTTTVRYPESGEIDGPDVTISAPSGNEAPSISDVRYSPAMGTSETTFTFYGTYSDENGDPPGLHDGVLGYMRLVLDGTSYDMIEPDNPDYVTGAEFAYSISGLSPGTHTYYLTASDGWSSARYPTSGELMFIVGDTSGVVYIVNGLDMVSIPLIPDSGVPDAVFGAEPPFALARWLPDAGQYSVYSLLTGYTTDPGFPSVAAGDAYWIKTNESKTLRPSGMPVNSAQEFTVQLLAGWNMVGCPFQQEVNWSALKVTLSGETLTLAEAATRGWVRSYGWTYDSSLRSYRLVDATRSGAERTMRPWRGYWMKALVNCQLVIPPPVSGG